MRIILLALSLMLALPASAENDALAALGERLGGLTSLQGTFRQSLISEQGSALEHSSGRFMLLRPGYLSWHILEPEEQLLIATGETLWHYDVELETVTRRRIPAGNPTSPLTILGGDTESLAEFYAVERRDADSWRLLPRFEGAEFSHVDLGFADGLPVRMSIRDRAGRETLVELVDLDTGQALTPSDFDFTPPPGVDIFSDEP